MPNKPPFKEYIKMLFGLLTQEAIRAGDKLWGLADRPMLLLVQLPIVIALWYIYDVSPYALYHDEWVMKSAAAMLGILLVVAYWLVFVYRFGRFIVQPAADLDHPSGPVFSDSSQRETPQTARRDRIAAIKSRAAFALLALLAASSMVCYAQLGYSLEPQRLYHQHKVELDRLAALSEGALFFYIEAPDAIGDEPLISVDFWDDNRARTSAHEMTETEKAEVSGLLHKLNDHYIGYVYRGSNMDYLMIGLHVPGEKSVDLVWFPDTAAVDQFIDPSSSNASQLDEHWWLTETVYSHN